MSRPQRSTVVLLALITGLPLLLCSGIATLLVGYQYALYVVVTLLALYVLGTLSGLLCWVLLRKDLAAEEKEKPR